MRMGLRAGMVVATVAAVVTPALPSAAESRAAVRTVRISLANDGAQSNQPVVGPQISADGRYVTFLSTASNLVQGDTNETWDVFLRDLRAGTTERVNVSSTGAQADGQVHSGALISADGRYVAFTSYATNLVPGDTNENSDVFVRDLVTGWTSRVSVTSTGEQGNGFSSFSMALSADGRYVVFDSEATNLVPGDTNGVRDLFLHDRRTGRTTRVNGPGGVQPNHFSEAPAISDDNRYLAYDSFASNLVPGDTNGFSDIFVLDRRTGRTTLVSRTPAGRPSLYNSWGPTLSADGRLVTFGSESPDVVDGDTNDQPDLFVHDRETGRTELVTVSSAGVQANTFSNYASISGNGRYVVFNSGATNLIPGDRNNAEDVFVRDLARRTTTRVSIATFGPPANAWSGEPSISADGRRLVFTSEADNLVADDTNDTYDVFLRDAGGVFAG